MQSKNLWIIVFQAKLHGLIVILLYRNAATETIKQELLFVGSEDGKLVAIRQMVQKGLKPPVLIFVQSIDRAKELFHELVYDGINVDVIHSERTKSQVMIPSSLNIRVFLTWLILKKHYRETISSISSELAAYGF